MRTFMKPSRLWATPDAPDQDWIKPHVLWLPQHDDQVLAYFGRLREIIRQYPDVVTPIEDEDLHLTVQSVRQKTADGVRVTDGHLKNAAVAIQHELEGMPPFDIEIGPARASGSAALVEIWPEGGPAELNHRVRTGLLAAGLDLPPAEAHFWPHMSAGYGKSRELHQMGAFALVA